MRACVRMLVVSALLVMPFGSSAFAAPVLTGYTVSYTDSIGPIGPLAVTVHATLPEICGAAGDVSCNSTSFAGTGGVLLDDDEIDGNGFGVITFKLEGGGGSHATPGYTGLGLDSTATFTLSNFVFTEFGVLTGAAFAQTDATGFVVTYNDTTKSVEIALGAVGIFDGANARDFGYLTLTLQSRSGQPPINTPEPSSLLLLGAGLLAAAGAARRRRSSR